MIFPLSLLSFVLYLFGIQPEISLQPVDPRPTTSPQPSLSSKYLTFQSKQVLQQPHDSTPASAFVASEEDPGTVPSLTVKARPTTVYRPRSPEAIEQARYHSLHFDESIPVEWDRLEVLGPDVEDRQTLAQLARMSGNAYAVGPGAHNWYDVDEVWNSSFPFGWQEDEGFRGHVFRSSDNSTVVLSIKGTTVRGPTSKLDKYNDNLLFSCCCARVNVRWVFRTVCNCYANHWRCDNSCLSSALIQDSLFYSIGVKLVNDLLRLYPSADVWLVGHSLGGALASLLGSTYGLPAVAFESPGERLAASRLHLPLPWQAADTANTQPNPDLPIPLPPAPVAVTHVYHTADPIPQGACTGWLSPCANAGYALETRCHLGKTIVYDTVGRLGWNVDVRTHIIRHVIHRILELDDVEWEKGREVPLAREEDECVDCHKWEFGDFKDIDIDM